MDRQPTLDSLFDEIRTYQDSQHYWRLLKSVSKMTWVAPYNAMLIEIQRSGCQFAATARMWHSIGATIKPGANPLMILQRFGPVDFVFDIADTEGGNDKEIEKLRNPFAAVGTIISPDVIKIIENNVKAYGIEINYQPKGAGLGGYCRGSENKEKYVKFCHYNKNSRIEYLIRCYFEVVVNSSEDVTTLFSSLIHELGHVFCGHIGSTEGMPWKDNGKADKNVKEFEAESVCWLVCSRLGIQTSSAGYLHGYIGKNNIIPRGVSNDNILKAAGKIEGLLKPLDVPPKELILSKEKIEKEEMDLFK